MEFNKHQSIYLQIADFICENIMTKKWPENEKILSVREMAASIEVNPNTVMRAYSQLQDEGVIFNKRGIGYFVSEGASQNIRKMEKENFIKNDLPKLFKKMQMLEIKIEELQDLYKELSNGKTVES